MDIEAKTNCYIGQSHFEWTEKKEKRSNKKHNIKPTSPQSWFWDSVKVNECPLSCSQHDFLYAAKNCPHDWLILLRQQAESFCREKYEQSCAKVSNHPIFL